MISFEFINKSVFFPEQGILAIGDLHIGREEALRQAGFMVPETQVREIIEDLEKIIKKIKEKKYKLKKIVFLGDIKHFFGYEWKERLYFKKVLEFLVRHVNEKDIILIKGNHDKFDFSGKKMKNYYFSKGIMFFHGHMDFLKINEERVKMWVMGHLHPSILLSDRQNIKREKYKCFLRGVYRGKEVIIVPSFFGAIEGSPVNSDEFTPEEGFSVIPPRELESFSAFVVTENEEVFDFGKVKNLQCA